MSICVKIQTKDGHSIANLNRRQAIRQRCLNCSAWVPSEITNCEFSDCQLFPFRSGKGRQDATARNKAIRSYCCWCCGDQKSEVLKCPSSDCPLWPYRKARIDRTAEIVSGPKKGHIEAFSEAI